MKTLGNNVLILHINLKIKKESFDSSSNFRSCIRGKESIDLDLFKKKKPFQHHCSFISSSQKGLERRVFIPSQTIHYSVI